jgi:hypothetical protein
VNDLNEPLIVTIGWAALLVCIILGITISWYYT